jgi:hypothetical protein
MKKVHWGSLVVGIVLVLALQWFLSKRRATA